jgi:Zn-dependent M28 family amino/carboxypeptidase
MGNKLTQMHKFSSILFLFLVFLGACVEEEQKPKKRLSNQTQAQLVVPEFNADSAYAFVAKQVSFGPRVPGTQAHAACAEWLHQTLQRFGGEAQIQHFKTRVYSGKIYSGKNIIASFNPDAKKRIMLSAHWDSRPFADYDDQEDKHYTPIDGANDGASGVGVILEIARHLQKQKPNIGVDVFFWDLEDYGEHKEEMGNHQNTWGLGSQYWSANPHQPGYRASYGILLDMVGAANPTFYREYYSQQYAPQIIDKVWSVAARLGYGEYFLQEENGVVMDDHYYVNTLARIPTIDIIHYNRSNAHGFFPQWHTSGDNMDIIEASTLKIVGRTVMQLIYEE